MRVWIFTKAPAWWTPEEWEMTPEEREKIGIKPIVIETAEDYEVSKNRKL